MIFTKTINPSEIRYYKKTTSFVLAASGFLTLLSGSAEASDSYIGTPYLSYTSQAYVDGYFNTQYSSALLGNGSLNVFGDSFSSSNNAQVTYSVPTGGSEEPDPIYDLVTSHGQYGFSYDGSAQVEGNQLKTQLTSSIVDSYGNLVDYSENTTLQTRSFAKWEQDFYIASDEFHEAGSYGAILVGITLDGSFPDLTDPWIENQSGVTLHAGSKFTDTAGVSYNTSFSIFSDASDLSWTGSQSVFQKLLFQYDTPFNVSLAQWFSSYETDEYYAAVDGNGSADFSHTGEISLIELPFGATLFTGSQQASLGNDFFSNVINSATLDAENTNWDFGNNGGGFTAPPQVPVPNAIWLFGSGILGLIGLSKRKQQPI